MCLPCFRELEFSIDILGHSGIEMDNLGIVESLRPQQEQACRKTDL